jgi:hypothetical protein
MKLVLEFLRLTTASPTGHGVPPELAIVSDVARDLNCVIGVIRVQGDGRAVSRR